MPFANGLAPPIGRFSFAPHPQTSFDVAPFDRICPRSPGSGGEFLCVFWVCFPPAPHTLRVATPVLGGAPLASCGFRAPCPKSLVTPLLIRALGELFSNRWVFGEEPPGPFGISPSASGN